MGYHDEIRGLLRSEGTGGTRAPVTSSTPAIPSSSALNHKYLPTVHDPAVSPLAHQHTLIRHHTCSGKCLCVGPLFPWNPYCISSMHSMQGFMGRSPGTRADAEALPRPRRTLRVDRRSFVHDGGWGRCWGLSCSRQGHHEANGAYKPQQRLFWSRQYGTRTPRVRVATIAPRRARLILNSSAVREHTFSYISLASQEHRLSLST